MRSCHGTECKSRLEYNSNGARIVDCGIRSDQDTPLNILKRGNLYFIEMSVVFDQDVQIVLPLTSMDQEGRLKAKAAIDAVCVGGTTNLSGGLMQGLQLLCQSDEAAREQADDAADGEAAVVVGSEDGGATRSLLLFTDGQANVGITDSGAMVAAAGPIV